MRSVVIISELSLHRDALKLTVKEATPFKVFLYCDLAKGIHKAIRLAPALVIIDRPHIRPIEFVSLFEHIDKDIKVVTIDWEWNKMVVYSRTAVLEANLDNLREAIEPINKNDAQKTREFGNAWLRKRPTSE